MNHRLRIRSRSSTDYRWIVVLVTTDSELRTHIDSSPAHPASAISLTGPFASFVATNVQTAVEKIDMKLSDETINRRIAVRNTNNQLTSGNAGLQDQINAEATTRGAADAAEQGARIAADSAEAGAREAGDNTLQDNIDTETLARTSADADLQAEDIVLHGRANDLQGQIDEIDDVIVPIGTIIPFYDFGNPAITFTSRWTYCDGSVISDPDSPLNGMTLPDLSGRYLVGFGTDGDRNMRTAGWDATAIGIPDHQINLQHSHTVNSHTHDLANHTHSTPTHSHTIGGHSHNVDIASFTSGDGGSHSHSVDSHYHSIPSPIILTNG